LQLTQLQNEILGTAHSEGRVHPSTFSSRLLHDLNDVHAAVSDLVGRGLVVAAKGDTYRLTERGDAAHRAREKKHRAAKISRTRTWQSG
jgi:Mn-dependent DtxR family transcriptional regulator